MKRSLNFEAIGARIMDARLSNGYSREQLAELAEISPGFIYEIESGRKGFSAYTLNGLVQALEISPDYLLYGEVIIECEKAIGDILKKFSPRELELVKQLLEIVYELTLQR